jgi:hypothetical protein
LPEGCSTWRHGFFPSGFEGARRDSSRINPERGLLVVFRGRGGKREAFPDGLGGDRPESFFQRKKGTKVLEGETKYTREMTQIGSQVLKNSPDNSAQGDATMQTITSKKRFSRSGCPSTHFFFKRDLADYSEPRSSNLMARSDMFCLPTGRSLAQGFHCAGHGHRGPEWDI